MPGTSQHAGTLSQLTVVVGLGHLRLLLLRGRDVGHDLVDHGADRRAFFDDDLDGAVDGAVRPDELAHVLLLRVERAALHRPDLRPRPPHVDVLGQHGAGGLELQADQRRADAVRLEEELPRVALDLVP